MKDMIVKAAEAVKHTKLYSPDYKRYVVGFASKPIGTTYYKGGPEPIVDILELCGLSADRAWLTVNNYNAVVLNTRDMFVADIDFGDERLSWNAGAKDEAEVIENVKALSLLDEAIPELSVAKESYRVYRTCKGCRVICTSRPFTWSKDQYPAEMLMRFLKSDREYMRLCKVQTCFRARLTPKPWRADAETASVCNLVYQHGLETIHPALADQVTVHDQMTLATGTNDPVLA